MVHKLKTWRSYYQAIEDGRKRFEIRKNDRAFSVGDKLVLQEWDHVAEAYTGNNITVYVVYLMHGGQMGIEPGFVVLGIETFPG